MNERMEGRKVERKNGRMDQRSDQMNQRSFLKES